MIKIESQSALNFDKNIIVFYTNSIYRFSEYNKNIDKIKEQYPNCDITIIYEDTLYKN